MAIFEHFKHFPKVNAEIKSKILDENRDEADKITLRQFCGFVNSPCHFDTELDLHKFIESTIPCPCKVNL